MAVEAASLERSPGRWEGRGGGEGRGEEGGKACSDGLLKKLEEQNRYVHRETRVTLFVREYAD